MYSLSCISLEDRLDQEILFLLVNPQIRTVIFPKPTTVTKDNDGPFAAKVTDSIPDKPWAIVRKTDELSLYNCLTLKLSRIE